LYSILLVIVFYPVLPQTIVSEVNSSTIPIYNLSNENSWTERDI